MGRVLMLIGLCVGAFTLYRLEREAPAPPATPPPPRLEVPPTPVVSEIELQKIRAAAQDADPHVRWGAIELLYRLRDPHASQVLRKLLATDSDPEVKRKAIEVLQKSGDPKYIDDILVALKDSDKNVRVAGLIALGDVADARAAGAVVAMLHDYEPEVRMQALHTVGRLQEKRQAEYQALARQLKREYEASLRSGRQARQARQTGFQLPNVEDLSQ